MPHPSSVVIQRLAMLNVSYEIQFVLSWNSLAWCRLSWNKDKLSRHVSMVWRGTAVALLLTHWSCCLLQSCARPSMCAYNIFYLCSTLAAHTNMYLILWTIARLRPAWRYMHACVINYFWPALCACLLCCNFFDMLTPVPFYHFFSSLILLFIYV